MKLWQVVVVGAFGLALALFGLVLVYVPLALVVGGAVLVAAAVLAPLE